MRGDITEKIISKNGEKYIFVVAAEIMCDWLTGFMGYDTMQEFEMQ